MKRVIFIYMKLLIGRKNEFDKLDELCKPIFENKFGGIVYIYGDAGIGKSSLLRSYSERKKNEIQIFLLQTDGTIQKSLNPFTYLFTRYFNQTQEKTPKHKIDIFESVFNNLISKIANIQSMKKINKKNIIEELERTKSIIASLVGIKYENSLYSNLEPKERFDNITLAIKNFFKAQSLLKPTIILFEDTHWIDNNSIKIVKNMVNNIEEFPILIISLSRYYENNYKFKFNTDKDIKEYEIDLEKFSKENVKEFSKVLLNGDCSDDLVSLIKERTEGNPFYIEQLNQYLVKYNLINKIEGQYTIQENIDNISSDNEDIIKANVEKLSEKEKKNVKFASIIGEDIDISVLNNIIDAFEKVSDDNVEEKSVDKEDDDFQIIHSLVKENIKKFIDDSELKLMYETAAKNLEDIYTYGDDDNKLFDIAYHYEKSGNTTKTIFYLEKAGNYAKENYLNEDAINLYNKLLTLKISDIKRIIIIKSIGYILNLTGEWDKALILIENNIKICRNINNIKFECQLLLFKMSILINKSNYDSILDIGKYIEKSLKNSKNDEDLITYIKSLNLIGNMCINLSDNSNASIYYNKCIKLSKNINYEKGYKTAIGSIALIEIDNCNFKKALELYEEQKNLCKKINDRKGYSIASGNMGIVYKKMGDYKNSLKCYNDYMILSKEIGFKKGYSIAVGNIGNLYLDYKEFDKAVKCYEEQRNISKELGSKFIYSRAIGNIAVVYMHKCKFDKAMLYLKEKVKICEEIGDKKDLAFAIGNIGQIYNYTGKYDKAKMYIEKKMNICNILKDKIGYYDAFIKLADQYIYQKMYDKALELNNKVLEEYSKINYKYGLNIVSNSLGILHVLEGNSEKSIEYFYSSFKLQKELNIEILETYLYFSKYFLSNKEHLEKYRKIIFKIIKLTGLKKDPESYFKYALENAYKKSNTFELIPALYFYGEYLLERKYKKEGIEKIIEAKKIAEHTNMAVELTNIKNICNKLNIDFGQL